MNDLLKPELTKYDSSRPLYSARALFFTAFFGGALAAILLFSLNSRALNRLKSDLFFYITAAVILFLFLYFAIIVPEGVKGFKWLIEYRRSNPLYKYGPRAVAMIIWIFLYALHKKYHKAMALTGAIPAKPWAAAIMCSVIGGILHVGFIFIVLFLRGAL